MSGGGSRPASGGMKSVVVEVTEADVHALAGQAARQLGLLHLRQLGLVALLQGVGDRVDRLPEGPAHLPHLPPAIVAKFDGKVMVLTGHEVDVVRRGANGTETSVPCYESYNHHYVSYIKGKGADVVALPESASAPQTGHGDGLHLWRRDGLTCAEGFFSRATGLRR